MGQKEMTVNILPTRTWNRLGMNESQIQIEWPEESVLIKPERLAAGVTWEKEISGKEWNEIQTGMGREYDAMAAECGTAGANRTDTVNGTFWDGYCKYIPAMYSSPYWYTSTNLFYQYRFPNSTQLETLNYPNSQKSPY